MSDTNRVAVGLALEVTPGTTSPTPAFQALRITGAPSLAFTPNTVTTDEIRNDRQVTDLILVGAEAGGDVGFEISSGALDTIIEGGMFAVWTNRNRREGSDITSIVTNVITVSSGTTFATDDLIRLDGFGDANDGVLFTATAGSATSVTAASGLTDNGSPPTTARVINVGKEGATGDIVAAITPNRLTSALLDFTTLGLVPGQWIKLGGALAVNQFIITPANNDYVRVGSGITANSLPLDIVPTGWAADAGTGRELRMFFGDYIRNGTLLQQYTFERRFTDIGVFEYFTGMAVNNLNFSLTQQAIATATATLLGFNANVQTSRFTGATDIAAPANTVYNTSTNVGRIARGGVPIAGSNFVTEVTIEINNNLRRQNAVANLGAIGVGVGEFSLTGSLNTYFDDEVLLNEVLNNTETSLDLRLEDNAGKVLLYDLPRTKYSSGAPAVPGKNQDVFINLGYQALLHPTLLYTMQLQRFHVVQ